RSFVTLEYQSTRTGSKGLFALDNLWDGLGALSVIYPQAKYYFGKVTMYNTYDQQARDMILYFMHKHFPDNEKLVTPIIPLLSEPDLKQMAGLFDSNDFREDFKTLNAEVRKLGHNIPPLVSAYMSLSPQMKVFGTAVNEEFGMVEETGILIALDEILEEKKARHIHSFIKEITGN
ncbi:MAG: hemolysin, partial [Bacteroidales bacterium]|nr:hemolysin [Bacteroidales bacterium]